MQQRPSDNLLILGAGQYSYVIEDIARLTGRFVNINCLDDNVVDNSRVIGRMADAASFVNDYDYAIVAIGNPVTRRELTEMLLKLGYDVPILVHSLAWVSPSAVLSPGVVVEAGAVVNAKATIGLAGLICAGAVVNHTAHIGDYCQIDCHATIMGETTVYSGTKIPAGTIVTLS